MKIVADKPVRQYELTFILSSSVSSDERQKSITAIEKLLKKNKFSITSSEDWGKKDLAYPIFHGGIHHREGVFSHLVIEGPAENIEAVSRGLKLEESLLRYLVVGATETIVPEEKASEETES
ncbi:MAG: 30S ribosomal protein S6 [Microgenomates group bacterium]